MSDKNNITSDNFESKLESLQAIVDKLESDVSLEQGIALFEQGLKLTKACISDLDTARASMEALKGQLDIITRSLSGGDDE